MVSQPFSWPLGEDPLHLLNASPPLPAILSIEGTQGTHAASGVLYSAAVLGHGKKFRLQRMLVGEESFGGKTTCRLRRMTPKI